LWFIFPHGAKKAKQKHFGHIVRPHRKLRNTAAQLVPITTAPKIIK